MNVDATQVPSVHDPDVMTTDPTHALVDVKLSPEAMGGMGEERTEQATGLAADLRQLEPAGTWESAFWQFIILGIGFQFPASNPTDGAPSEMHQDPSTQVAGSSISISQGTPLPPYVARLMEYEKLKQNPYRPIPIPLCCE